MCPGITDNAIRGRNGSMLPGERNELSGEGPRLRAVMNRTRQPTCCRRKCQQMIAYKMYQLPPRLPARPHPWANKHISCQPAPAQPQPGPGASGRVERGLAKSPLRAQEAIPVPMSPQQQVNCHWSWRWPLCSGKCLRKI